MKAMERIFNILVFPCGSEIGLEIHRSLRYSSHVNLYGASSVKDHGRFLYKQYFGNFPYVDAPEFLSHVATIVKAYKIDAIYPTMDSVIDVLSKNANDIGCSIIASPPSTAAICLSKKRTYDLLCNVVPTPKVYSNVDMVDRYPVFLKPDKGYGSRGAKKALNKEQVAGHLKEWGDCLIVEYLPGREFTVDCFTNFKGELQFVSPRLRARVTNGISVNTQCSYDNGRFNEMAEAINRSLKFQGAWFFQVKENFKGKLVLMEIASRLAGSSAIHRCQGVNFALLSIFDLFEIPVEIPFGKFDIELDRALCNRYSTRIDYRNIYIDFDDTLIVRGKVNIDLIKAIYFFINSNRNVFLLTKHEHNIDSTLKSYRLTGLFDKVVHIKKWESKADYIEPDGSIFIDDSFAERMKVMARLRIPVFAPDAVECLIEWE